MPLIDSYNRKIDYLRVSITDRCNLRCTYCMPSTGVEWLPREEILRYEEILRLVKIAVQAGIKKVRISGGEPLLRRNLIEFIKNLSAIEAIEDLSLTTNALLLAEYALPLKHAGLNRVNVSLDTLNPERYQKLTGGGDLKNVQLGLKSAQDTGLSPIKINVVVLKGINDDEWLDFAELVKSYPWEVRFIELRPHSPLYPQAYLPINDVWQKINNRYPLQEIPNKTSSTAILYTFEGAQGRLGFIGKAEDTLCKTCNRMRLSASGQLYPCLFSSEYFDLKSPLRQGANEEILLSILRQAVAQKPPQLSPLCSSSATPMFKIGG